MKSTIIHFIQNLGRGGAETMLISVIKELKDYKNIIVAIGDENDFKNELVCDEYISLKVKDSGSILSIPFAIGRLKKIIEKYKPSLVHSHLPISNFVARLAIPKSIPLITTLHTSTKRSPDYRKWYFREIDRFTYRYRPSTIIGCGETPLNEYFSALRLRKGKTALIYNFVDISLINPKSTFETSAKFKMICVANLRYQKNLFYLVKAMTALKKENIELHIFGEGPLREALEKEIERSKVNVTLHGKIDNIKQELYSYDLYVMSSFWEGLSLSVNEAMAACLPLLLSDIPSFREQAADSAIYFSLTDQTDFVNKIVLLKNNLALRKELGTKSYERVKNKFTLQRHLSQLKELYESETNDLN